MPLAMLVSGFLTEQFGLLPILVACGLIYLVTTVSAIFIPAMRELDEHPNLPPLSTPTEAD